MGWIGSLLTTASEKSATLLRERQESSAISGGKIGIRGGEESPSALLTASANIYNPYCIVLRHEAALRLPPEKIIGGHPLSNPDSVRNLGNALALASFLSTLTGCFGSICIPSKRQVSRLMRGR
ncbi:hypothetical protein ABVK25_011998 [Lepraria finkii]|uniref:Uncharacterized protein n=1 Tax=Lepraria finkii TaxID=1340010 RepID=A0ABR4AQW0_9LECA